MKTSGKRLIVGVMGGSHVSREIYQMAFELGALIAENRWLLLNGGRDAGVMRASAEGAKSRSGITIGVLPGDAKEQANPFIDIPIVTGMADARNLVNVLSSDVIVCCPGSAGTISELALALKNGVPVILLNFDVGMIFDEFVRHNLLYSANTPAECIQKIIMLKSV